MVTKILCLLWLGLPLWAQFTNYTEREQVNFALSQLKPIVDMVMGANTPYPAVNERIKQQDALIKRRFGSRPLVVNLRPTYHVKSPWIPAASGVVSDGPRIVMYVSAIMNNWVDNLPHWIRCLMHERDHLTEMEGNISKVNLELETHMHALTTEFVTVPMKERYMVTLSRNDQKHYDAWVRAGRTEKSQVWRDYIKSLLSPVLD